MERIVLPSIIFIDVIPFQSKSKHLCGVHESDSKAVNTKRACSLCSLRKTERERGVGRNSLEQDYNTDTNRNIKQWKRIENADICAQVSTKKQLDTDFKGNVEEKLSSIEAVI